MVKFTGLAFCNPEAIVGFQGDNGVFYIYNLLKVIGEQPRACNALGLKPGEVVLGQTRVFQNGGGKLFFINRGLVDRGVSRIDSKSGIQIPEKDCHGNWQEGEKQEKPSFFHCGAG